MMTRTLVAITGASSGIGEAFARRLAAGHDLLLIARRRDRLERLQAELAASSGGKVEIIAADLTSEEDVAGVAQRLRSQPNLGLLINNAGFGTKGRFWEADLDEQMKLHELHVMATLSLTHAALQILTNNNAGAIVNVSSVAAYIRSPGAISYSATKTWMNAFTEGLHLELKLAGSNVQVQALCPGFTRSEFHQTLGVAAEHVAPRFLWLTAEDVVEASLQGLAKRKLFVVPGWRYRVAVSLLSALPVPLRLALERSGPRARALRGTQKTLDDQR